MTKIDTFYQTWVTRGNHTFPYCATEFDTYGAAMDHARHLFSIGEEHVSIRRVTRTVETDFVAGFTPVTFAASQQEA